MDYSLLIAPASAFAGVIISTLWNNYSNKKRHTEQRENEKQTKTAERKLALKKEIFLPIIENITQGMSNLAKFTRADIDQNFLFFDFSETAHIRSKIYVVGSQEIISSSHRLTREINNIYLKLVLLRLEFNECQKKLKLSTLSPDEFDQINNKSISLCQQILSIYIDDSEKLIEPMVDTICLIREELEMPIDRKELYLHFKAEYLKNKEIADRFKI